MSRILGDRILDAPGRAGSDKGDFMLRGGGEEELSSAYDNHDDGFDIDFNKNHIDEWWMNCLLSFCCRSKFE